MQKSLYLGCVVLACCGCGSRTPPSGKVVPIVKDIILEVKRAKDTLSSLTDQASAENAALELKQAAARVHRLTQRFKSLGKLPQTEMDCVEFYEQEMNDVGSDFLQETESFRQKLARLKLTARAAQNLNQGLTEFSLAMQEFSQIAQEAEPDSAPGLFG